jgi:hypothetical protein
MKKGRCVHGERLGSTLNRKGFKDKADGLEYSPFIGEDWGVYIHEAVAKGQWTINALS